MKKIILLGSMALLTLSCGSDDDDNNVVNNNDPALQSAILPVKMSIDGETMKINYDGTKITNLTSTSNSSNKLVFEYNGDFITSIKFYEGNVLQTAQEYEYTSNLLTKAVNKEYAANGTTIQHSVTNEYTHTSATSIKVKRTVFGGATQPIMNTTYTFNNGNMVSSSGNGTLTTGGTATNYTESSTYTYTDKNYPFKNVKGMDKLIHTDERTDGLSDLFSNRKNSINSYKSTTAWTAPSSNGTAYSGYKYTAANYNSSGYPTYESRTQTNADGTTSTSAQPEIYTYEYNH